MNLHFADISPDRGQYELLVVEENCCNGLFSFAYLQACAHLWEKAWSKYMHVYLAGMLSHNKSIQELTYPEINKHLTTYTDQREIQGEEKAWDKSTVPIRAIIDSGAFTAFTTGKAISAKEYGKWALTFQARWEDRLQALHFMNLDVIGDQDATWSNQKKLEAMGLKPLPIVTFGVDLKHLDFALANYDYVALGGLVPYVRNPTKLKAWLNACFKRIIEVYKKTGVMPKIHLLGVTTKWILQTYPCYSSDSSTWTQPLRFGEAKASGLGKVPSYKHSDATKAATIHALRHEIRKFKAMEKEATDLWKSRGIYWND